VAAGVQESPRGSAIEHILRNRACVADTTKGKDNTKKVCVCPRARVYLCVHHCLPIRAQLCCRYLCAYRRGIIPSRVSDLGSSPTLTPSFPLALIIPLSLQEAVKASASATTGVKLDKLEKAEDSAKVGAHAR
jgi:hypothetical protein